MTIVHANYKMWSSALLLQAILFCTHAHAEDMRYVKPDNSSAINCPGKPCHTLSEFSENSDRYATTGSIFTFMNGNHSLHTKMWFLNVSDITLRGVDNNFVGKILLINNGSIGCYNVSNFHIEGLTFIFCKYQPLLEPVGGSLNFIISNKIIIINSTFQGNGNGTLITVRAIYSEKSNVTVLNCNFERNTDLVGGAIAAWFQSNLTITGSRFYGNRAKNSGGAISVIQSVITLNGTPENIFVRNIANEHNGGAVACELCNFTMMGNNTFEQNGLLGLPSKGGAVGILNGRLQFKPGNTLFLRNEGNKGGAIVTISKLAIMCDAGAIIVMEGNKADYGGGGAYFVNSIVQVHSKKCLVKNTKEIWLFFMQLR